MRETLRITLAAAVLAAAPGAGGVQAQGPGAAQPQSIPVPPQPPPAPRDATAPPATNPAPAPGTAAVPDATPSGSCSQQDAAGKAERLLNLLRFLIARDPNRAQGLLNEFQGAVQHLQDGSANLAATCRAYDALIARATE